MMTESEIESLNEEGFGWVLWYIDEYKNLCARAADALEKTNALLFHAHGETLRSKESDVLLKELRKAAK